MITALLFLTVPEVSGKKNSAVPVEIWENTDTKNLQAHFNYPNRLGAEKETYSSFPAFLIPGLNTSVLDVFRFSNNWLWKGNCLIK